MTKYKKQVLSELSKEQLIYLIEQLEHSQFLIGCTLVDVSKSHIDPDKAIDKIRGYMYDMPSLYNANELKSFIDFKMKKISVEEYRNIIGLERLL